MDDDKIITAEADNGQSASDAEITDGSADLSYEKISEDLTFRPNEEREEIRIEDKEAFVYSQTNVVSFENGEAEENEDSDEEELNAEDTEELADEIGVSGVFDAYGREVIRDVFENRLRMAKNSVKLAYGKLKNELLSYAEVKRRYVGREERFYKDGEWFVKFAVGDGVLQVATGEKNLEVKKEKGGGSIKEAVAEIGALAEKLGLAKKENYTRIAYAERYPFNPEAVLSGEEEMPPEETDYSGAEYEPIEGELNKDIISELMGEDFDVEERSGQEKLDALRQQATTIKGAVALTEPIVYFYNAARTDENEIAYVNVQQVLNDKFLGKMLPQQFFAVAEGSERIETLNLLSVKQAATDCDSNPSTVFVTQTSARLLIKDAVLQRLIKNARTENGNLALAFDCALLEALGERGLVGIRRLTENGVKIMIDNTENAGLKVLTEYNFDYLRFDARYYKEEDEKKTAHLDMVVGYAKVQGIKTTAIYVNTVKEAKYFLTHGIGNIEGDLVGSPVRLIHNAIKEAKKLPLVK